MSTKLPRPSQASLERELARLQRGRRPRLTIETTPEVLQGAAIRAAQEGVTVREYVLQLLAADKVPGAQADLAESQAQRRGR